MIYRADRMKSLHLQCIGTRTILWRGFADSGRCLLGVEEGNDVLELSRESCNFTGENTASGKGSLETTKGTDESGGVYEG